MQAGNGRLLAWLLPIAACVLAWLAHCGPAAAGKFDTAIAFGNKTYMPQFGVPPVEFADRDAAAFLDAARDVLEVPADRRILVTDALKSTFHMYFGVKEAREGRLWSLLRTSPAAKLYVYYSGHGLPHWSDADNKPNAYLLPIDGVPSAANTTGYALSELMERLREIKRELLPQGEVILVLEACFSGDSPAGKLQKDVSSGGLEIDLGQESGQSGSSDIIVIAAAQANQVANWDREFRQGLLTDSLLDGLYGFADEPRHEGNNDKTITLGELKRYTLARMEDRRRQLANRPGAGIAPQTPSFAGPDSLKLASFAGAYAVRDPARKSEEDASCRRLQRSEDIGEIDRFLGSCKYCACRDQLRAHRTKLVDASTMCAAERGSLRELRQRGDERGLAALAEDGKCSPLKPEIVAVHKEVEAMCAAERRAFAQKRSQTAEPEELRRWSGSLRCTGARREVESLAASLEQDCGAEQAEWDRVQADRGVDALRKFASTSGCPKFKAAAIALADRIDNACRTERQRLDNLAGRDNIAALQALARTAECAQVKRVAEARVAGYERRCNEAEAAWARMKESAEPAAQREFLKSVECPKVRGEVERHLKQLERAGRPQPAWGATLTECEGCPAVVPVRPACFVMGSTRESDRDSEPNEGPQQTVRISQPYGIGAFEVKVSEWALCHRERGCDVAPPADADGDLPMTGISWQDAQAYVRWLSQRSGSRYRLPSEAEWENAARAGSRGPFSTGPTLTVGQARFFHRDAPRALAKAGSFPPNAFGLHDVHGNAAELVEDCYQDRLSGGPTDGSARTRCSSIDRVIRGGSWRSPSMRVRSAFREQIKPAERSPTVGLRVARDMPELAGSVPAPVCPAESTSR